jgi:hypothetical protein
MNPSIQICIEKDPEEYHESKKLLSREVRIVY